jgi:hypothetical protein
VLPPADTSGIAQIITILLCIKCLFLMDNIGHKKNPNLSVTCGCREIHGQTDRIALGRASATE